MSLIKKIFGGGLGGRVDQTKPVEPPEGFKWAVSTSWRYGGLYELYLIPEDHYLDKLGLPRKIGKDSRVSLSHIFSPSEDIYKESEVRKKSIKMVKEHYEDLAEKKREADALKRIEEWNR